MSLIKKIKAAMAAIGIKPAQDISTFKPGIIQEDTRDQATRRRVAKHIAANHELLVTRAMRPHGFDCEDNQMCTKEDCWEWKSDVVVSKPYLVDAKTLRRLD